MEKPSMLITPLGAAIVEAMPNRAEQKRIQRNFKRNRICPTSAIFPTVKDVEQFYAIRAKRVKGVEVKSETQN